MGWLIITVLALGIAWWSDRRRRVYADLETIPAAAVYAGRNEVKGRAWHPEPVIAHHTRQPCVVWRFELEEERKTTRTSNGKTTTTKEWKTIEEREDGCSYLELVDESGSVRVRLAKASVGHRQLMRETLEVDDDRGFFEKLLSFGPNRTGRYRRTETGIVIGDRVFVTGEASLRTDVVEPQIDHGRPFVVSTRSEDSHRTWLGAVTGVLLTAAVGSAVVAGAATQTRWAPPVFAGITIAVIISGALISLYNRLQHQVQSAARAWSLIDIQLARRHDLIPRLASVAKGLIDHERVLLESLAIARTSLAGEPPTEATVARADHEAAEQTNRINQLLVLIEDYPSLKADDAMLEVQRQIADAENRISGTRGFYNDSVTLLRNQRQTFPGVLVARFADTRRFVLFTADGFERTVPEIDFDWNVGRSDPL
ncbi:MAG: LemA family protein [Actinomycetota bacterium]